MSLLAWAFGGGLLLLGMALSSGHVARMPLTPAVVYLVIGAVIGPAGLGLLRIDFVRDAKLLELLGEVAVAVSLFLSGSKLRRPPTDGLWRPAYVLVGPVMLVSIAGSRRSATARWAFRSRRRSCWARSSLPRIRCSPRP